MQCMLASRRAPYAVRKNYLAFAVPRIGGQRQRICIAPFMPVRKYYSAR